MEFSPSHTHLHMYIGDDLVGLDLIRVDLVGHIHYFYTQTPHIHTQTNTHTYTHIHSLSNIVPRNITVISNS